MLFSSGLSLGSHHSTFSSNCIDEIHQPFHSFKSNNIWPSSPL